MFFFFFFFFFLQISIKNEDWHTIADVVGGIEGAGSPPQKNVLGGD